MRLVAHLTLAILLSGAPGCGLENAWTNCSSSSTGSSVEVSGSQTTPGSQGPGEQSGGGGATAKPEIDEPECTTDLCRGGYSVVSLPDVTASDLVSFVPQRPSATGEPAGLGVVGMPANLIAATSTQILSGPLLGYDVRVRFTPIAYMFDYGDGTVRSASTGGAPWSALGLAAFSPTATSHAYRAPGAYRASVQVVYSASVDFGSGSWRPVRGEVTSAATGYDIRIVEVATALVARTCDESPRGPGC